VKKNLVRKIFIHTNALDFHTLADKVNEFHVEIIERRLENSNFTKKQKLIIINRIIEELKSREVNHIIK